MIVLIEPQCRGFQHEKCNAGAVALYLNAFPNDEIHFFAEKSHLSSVIEILDIGKIKIERLFLHEIQIPESKLLSKISIIYYYYKLFYEVIGSIFFSSKKIKRVVLLSSYAFNLLAFKVVRFRLIKNVEVNIFLHGAIEMLRSNFIFNPLLIIKRGLNLVFRKLGLNFKFKISFYKYLHDLLLKPVFYFGGNKEIKYILFRKDSVGEFSKIFPFLSENTICIDHPCIDYENCHINESQVFSYIFKQRDNNFDFLLNSDFTIKPQKSHCFNIYESQRLILNLSLGSKVGFNFKFQKPINRSRFEVDKFILNSKYMIYLYSEDSYILTTSGAFFDAIMLEKPILFLNNPCFNYYFKDYKFGYRFENIVDLRDRMVEIINQGDENYQTCINEIRRLKKSISIENNVNKLLYEKI